MSQNFSVIVYMKVTVEKHIPNFFLFVFKIFKKKSPLSKIWKNSHKSYKIYKNFWAILEDRSSKTATVKKKTKNW